MGFEKMEIDWRKWWAVPLSTENEENYYIIFVCRRHPRLLFVVITVVVRIDPPAERSLVAPMSGYPVC